MAIVSSQRQMKHKNTPWRQTNSRQQQEQIENRHSKRSQEGILFGISFVDSPLQMIEENLALSQWPPFPLYRFRPSNPSLNNFLA